MVSKDQSIGGAIFLICLIIAIFYVITLFYPDWIVNLGWASDRSVVQFWLIAIPVFIAFIAIMGIGAWIGWTMATTPPPKPIEEITSEIEEEEKKEEKEAETAKESKEEAAETEEKGKGKTKK
jgi:ABC-type transport system involved in cytochrome bd biosynthesis fused ATPase/permease subunit